MLQDLENRFKAAFRASVEIFGDMAFQIPPKQQTERSKLSRALFDAVMVSLDSLEDQQPGLVRASDRIVNELRQFLSNENAYAILVGRPNTAKALKERIDSIETILRQSAHV